MLGPVWPAVLLLSGCDRAEPTRYVVPTEERIVQGSVREELAGASGEPASAGAFEPGEVPSAWVEQPATQFRLASYRIPGAGGDADLSVIAFPGDAGGFLPNVNRWRGQVGLEPGTEESIGVEKIELQGLPVRLVEFEGADPETGNPMAILGGITATNGRSWFFKVMGPPSVVSESKVAFLKFIETSRMP